MSWIEAVWVVVVGVVAGLDLVSVPQAMIGRPMVAGFLGGLVVGRPLAGLMVGALLELFALETLPVGAARYPDWGPSAAAAGSLAGSGPSGPPAAWLLGVVLVAAVVAWVGGWSMHLMRRTNAAAVRLKAEALEAGDPRALAALQLEGLMRDGGRAGVLTVAALMLGRLAGDALAEYWRAPNVAAQTTVVAAAVGVGIWSGWRLFGRGAPAPWFAAGLALGTALVVGWR